MGCARLPVRSGAGAVLSRARCVHGMHICGHVSCIVNARFSTVCICTHQCMRVYLCAFTSTSINLLCVCIRYVTICVDVALCLRSVTVYGHILVYHICDVACVAVEYNLCTCMIHVQNRVCIWVRCLCGSGCVCISACMPMHVCIICVII